MNGARRYPAVMRWGAIARTLTVIGLVAALTTVIARLGLGVGVLHLAPALMLFGALLARRYPGERHVIALTARARRGTGRPRRACAVVLATPRPSRVVPRGGLLLGSALAERGPPTALTFS